MRLILSVIFSFIFVFNSYSQVTNLTVNGFSSDFVMSSGDTVSWFYNVPNPGDTTQLEFWIDVDNNGEINNEIDVPWIFFSQIDGGEEEFNGPPDMDGEANSEIYFEQRVGLAPGNYVLLFDNNNSPVAIAGTVTELIAPTFTISGNVSAPDGIIKENLMMNIESDQSGGNFWGALTDADGNFTIRMDGDTTGNPWKIGINNSFILKSAVISPERILITLDSSISKNYEDNDFTIHAASAEISGVLLDDDFNPISNSNVYVYSHDISYNKNVNTDTDGKFYIGFFEDELPITNLNLGSGNYMDSTIMELNYNFPEIKSGENYAHNVLLLKINSSIEGRLTFNGSSFGMREIFANCSDTGYVRTFTDNNGYFKFNISDKIYNYTIVVRQIPPEYMNDSLVVHPGDKNANLNLSLLTNVKNKDLFAEKFFLLQNYPNPFNPTTTIKYQIEKEGFVTLKVYDLLGNEVASLVNNEKEAGVHEIKFNAKDLSSGIYFYQIKSGGFTSTKKLTILK